MDNTIFDKIDTQLGVIQTQLDLIKTGTLTKPYDLQILWRVARKQSAELRRLCAIVERQYEREREAEKATQAILAISDRDLTPEEERREREIEAQGHAELHGDGGGFDRTGF